MGQIFAAILNIIGTVLVALFKAIGSIISFLWNGIKKLFVVQQKRNANNSIQNILNTFNKALTTNNAIKNEALTVLTGLPDVPEKQNVNHLINYCNTVENNLQTYIGNINKDISNSNSIDASFIKTKYQNAIQYVKSISYEFTVQELQSISTKYSSDNYFIDTLLDYSHVQNPNYRNGIWTYQLHGISYQMRLDETNKSIIEIKAKKQSPIRFTPNPRIPQTAQTLYSEPLAFDSNHELVFSLKKERDTIDHYDVFEYFDHVSHLLDKPEINPCAGKQLLTYREAEEIEDSVVDNIKGLSKIAPPPPDYVPDSQKMHGGRMRWANYFDVEKSGMLSTKGFVLGKMGYGSYLYTGSYKGHILTIAATRTGKGVGVVIPNLLIHKGSSVILDPKGENFAVTANERIKLGNKVFYYDPWEIIPELEKKKHGSISVNAQKACINPLDIIGQRDRDMLDKALMLASSLIVRTSDKDNFFYNEAETFLARLIVFVCAKYPKDNPHRNLVEVRKLLNLDLLSLKAEVSDPIVNVTTPPVEELVKWLDRNISAKSKSTNNVIDMAQQATTFLSSHMVANSLKKSNIDIMRMKLNPTSLYLILDTNKILFNEDVYKPLVRLIVTTCFCAASIREQPREPMLFMLDEVAQLGTLQYLPKLLAIYAGMGVVVWTIWQSLAQIKSLYDKDAETITGNCSIQQYFGVNDTETAELICKMAGKTTIFEESYSKTDGTSSSTSTTEGWGNSYGHGTSSSKGTNSGNSYQGFNYTSSNGTNTSTSESESYSDSYNFSKAISKGESHTSGVTMAKKTADLITPAEVMQAKSIGVQFLFFMEKCMYPILCGKIAYYEDKEFSGLFDENYTRL